MLARMQDEHVDGTEAELGAQALELDGPEAQLERVLAQARAELDERIVENADGTLIVRLVEPITVDGQELGRLTVRRVRVRDVRAVFGVPEIQALAYADLLIEPARALDELATEYDFNVALRAVERALEKFRSAGRTD